MRARCGLSNLPMAIETGTDPSGLSSFTRVPEIIRLVIWVFLTIEALKLSRGCVKAARVVSSISPVTPSPLIRQYLVVSRKRRDIGVAHR
jgi:hypothetical protein